MAFQGEYFIDRYGKKAAEHSPPISRMLKMEVPVGAGTDGTRVASYNPWMSLYWLVSGKTVGGTPLYPEANRLDRTEALRRYTVGVFSDTLAHLAQRFGADLSSWHWGRLHRLPLRHVLSNRGDLGQLLDHGGGRVKGDMTTVCNTGSGPDWQATTGACYRLIADLGTACLMAVDVQSQSGHVNTPHYSDQLAAWNAGKYHVLPLDRADVSKVVVETLQLCPSS